MHTTNVHPIGSSPNVIPTTNLILLDEFWFTPGGGQDNVCIVLVEDATMHYVKSYIGTGRETEEVVKWGAKVPRELAESIFGYQPNWYER